MIPGSPRPRGVAVTPALGIFNPTDWIDCNQFPENITCKECGNTGPGSVVCCPDNNCVVIDRNPRISATNSALSGILRSNQLSSRFG
jgi:hypothetical protein